MTYQPKGSLCMNCFWKYKNCSKLPFHEMKVIERLPEKGILIVKCDKYEKEENENQTR